MRREIEDLKAVNRRVVATLVRLEGKLDDVSERMATKEQVSSVYNHLDRMSADLEDVKQRLAIQSSILGEHGKMHIRHDQRLASIEAGVRKLEERD